jgi:uncharacterized Zn finger protein
MMKLTENVIRDFFSDKTFFRGLDYYKNGNVFGPVKMDNTLYAQVLGSLEKPYEVRAFLDDQNISTRCTCPVGSMCKHGVALLLNWVHEPLSFIDYDKFLISLKSMSKDEIIHIIKTIINQKPSLISDFSLNLEKDEKPEINMDAISNKIDWIVHGELDYYHIWDAIQNLEEIKNIADRFRDKQSYKNAARIYLALVKGSITAYDEGVDDSDGGMGDLVFQCITDFNKCMQQINDIAYKDMVLETILDIVDEEDYGLETQDMLLGVINEENIHRVEEYLLEKLNDKIKSANEFRYEYKKEAAIRILINLYEQLGKPEEKLRIAQYELVDKDDYARLAKVLIEEERFEEAFDTIKKGLALPGKPSITLNELYVLAGRTLVHQNPDLVDFTTSFKVALEIMSMYFHKEKYEAVKEIFSGIDKLEEFKTAMLKSFKDRDSVVQALLYDDEVKTAIDVILAESVISPQIIIKVSKAAMDGEMMVESGLLTRMVLERGWSDTGPAINELLMVMIDVLDITALRELCNHIIKKRSSGTALMLIPCLIKKSPELSAVLVKHFIEHIPVEVVGQVATAVAGKSPKQGSALCRMRINDDMLRSHVHYDKVIFLFRIIRDIYTSTENEPEWLECIRRFVAENKGKKKLIEMLQKEFKVFL